MQHATHTYIVSAPTGYVDIHHVVASLQMVPHIRHLSLRNYLYTDASKLMSKIKIKFNKKLPEIFVENFEETHTKQLSNCRTVTGKVIPTPFSTFIAFCLKRKNPKYYNRSSSSSGKNTPHQSYPTPFTTHPTNLLDQLYFLYPSTFYICNTLNIFTKTY